MAPLFGQVVLFVQFWQTSSCEIILRNYFELGQVVQEEIEFKDTSYIKLCPESLLLSRVEPFVHFW